MTIDDVVVDVVLTVPSPFTAMLSKVFTATWCDGAHLARGVDEPELCGGIAARQLHELR
jgi:hypothetical protein